MDGCPNIAELMDTVKLSNSKINKLAKYFKISIEKQIRGKDRLEKLFKKWLEVNGAEATRKNMIEALQNINEMEIANTYYAFILSMQKRKLKPT